MSFRRSNWLTTLFLSVSRLYSDYLYFKMANKSAEDFHQKVTESVQLFQSCLSERSLRSCVYNTSLSNAMPVSWNYVFTFNCLNIILHESNYSFYNYIYLYLTINTKFMLWECPPVFKYTLKWMHWSPKYYQLAAQIHFRPFSIYPLRQHSRRNKLSYELCRMVTSNHNM